VSQRLDIENVFVGGVIRKYKSKFQPILRIDTQTTVKDIGGIVEIKCSVFNASECPVAWSKFEK